MPRPESRSKKLMAMKPDPDYLPEHQDALEKAKKLQEKLK